MALDREGVVSISYRPLATIDRLHLLLLAATTEADVECPVLEQTFSLPASALAREMLVLERFGLARSKDGCWLATDRGRHIAAVWSLFGKQKSIDVVATARKWRLGPGNFAVDEMARNLAQIHGAADELGITQIDSAEKYLSERRSVAEQFARFRHQWLGSPHLQEDEGVVEQRVFEAMACAESDDALNQLEDLFRTYLDSVSQQDSVGVRPARSRPDQGGDRTQARREHGREALHQFQRKRRDQSRKNRKVTACRRVCEALLLEDWIWMECRSLGEVFEAEPAAFTFKSTVPLTQPKKRSEAPRLPSPSRSPPGSILNERHRSNDDVGSDGVVTLVVGIIALVGLVAACT